jgi:hypothetical protein
MGRRGRISGDHAFGPCGSVRRRPQAQLGSKPDGNAARGAWRLQRGGRGPDSREETPAASLEVSVAGERGTGTPAVWTTIEMVYRLGGKLDDKAVRDAIELSQKKYCSVAAMLGKTANITYRYEIIPES